MYGMQEQFEQVIKKEFERERIFSNIIRRQFKLIGVEITDEQLALMRMQLFQKYSDSLNISLSDDQIKAAGYEKEADLKEDVERIFRELPKELEAYGERAEKAIEASLLEVCDYMAQLVYDSLLESKADFLLRQKEIRENFERNIRRKWGGAISSLEAYIDLVREVGSEFNESARRGTISNPYTIEIITRLHARACQISSEILTLIKSGYADGAFARWRSLHEVAVVGLFICYRGEDVAKRYTEYEVIEEYRAENLRRQILSNTSNKKFNQLMACKDALTKKYGKEYANEYGWAANDLKNQKPKFRDIEIAVEMSPFRVKYKEASYNIHADPKGVFFKIGLRSEHESVLLSGPSNIGLEVPAECLRYSLSALTVGVLNIEPTVDGIVSSKVIQMFGEHVVKEFSTVKNGKGIRERIKNLKIENRSFSSIKKSIGKLRKKTY